jgi:hypothetical protein
MGVIKLCNILWVLSMYVKQILESRDDQQSMTAMLSLNSNLFWTVTMCDWSKGGWRAMCGSGLVPVIVLK